MAIGKEERGISGYRFWRYKCQYLLTDETWGGKKVNPM